VTDPTASTAAEPHLLEMSRWLLQAAPRAERHRNPFARISTTGRQAGAELQFDPGAVQDLDDRARINDCSSVFEPTRSGRGRAGEVSPVSRGIRCSSGRCAT
jgi:hypothetical protein